MRHNVIALIAVVAIILFVFGSCGSKSDQNNSGTIAYLPEKIENTDITRTSEPKTFVGDSLWEYINGGAEIYHSYNFVEVSTAYYQLGNTEVVADIYLFSDADNAYGMLTALRPDNPTPVTYGVEGFNLGTGVDFVKGSYLVRIVGYEDTEETMKIIETICHTLDKLVPGKTSLPETFSLFPAENYLEYTRRIFAESFLGQKFLSEVYTQLYLTDSDTLTLFLLKDVDGSRLAQWREAITESEKDSDLSGLAFDGECFVYDHPYRGRIIAGKKSNWMVGSIGGGDAALPLLTSWLGSLSKE